MHDRRDNLIWIDLEMTGLNPDRDHIIEIATIVTDRHLDILAEGPVIAVHQSGDVLNEMDEWNTSTHTESGLVERVRESEYDEDRAAEETIAFLQDWVEIGVSPMCGNSICQDRRFLWRYMPRLEAYFHYRNLDVSTIKELVRRWKPEVLEGLTKESKHQALDDIRDSIEEMKYYREKVFSI